jgi:4,5-dihydroxyphthalate decarboxylase
VPDWSQRNDYDAGEVSFSQYVQGQAGAGYPLHCLPHFMMRGFRHRCMLTRSNSPVTRLEELGGKRIGITGWPDSGNTWTRALLRRVGVGINDVHWLVERLIAEQPGQRSLIGLLKSADLDAVFTPFLPPEFFNEDSGLRFLLPDFRREELCYFEQVGYVPGIHLLGVRPQLCDDHPWVAAALSEAFEESARVWANKRMKYADTTPWLIDDIAHTKSQLPADWNANGLESNEKMIDDFAAELYEQRIVDKRLDAKALFAH